MNYLQFETTENKIEKIETLENEAILAKQQFNSILDNLNIQNNRLKEKLDELTEENTKLCI